MKADRTRGRVILIGGSLAGVVFAVDLSVPLGVAGGVPYIAVILVVLWSPKKNDIYVAAITGSTLTVLGYFLSPHGGVAWMVLVNRFLALFAIWVTAILLLQRRKADELRLTTLNKLEETVAERTTELKQANQALEADVIERQKSAQLLDATQTRLGHLLSASPTVIYACKPTGDFGATFISENVVTQLGYQPHEFIEDASFWAEHIHLDDRERVLSGLSGLFEAGVHAHEYRFWHKDGMYRWMHDELTLIRDDAGKPLEIIGCLFDITERKQMETSLRKNEQHYRMSEQRYRILAETATDAILAINMKSIIEYANPAAERIFGHTIAEMVGQPISMLIPESLKAAHAESVKRYLETGERRIAWYNFALTALHKTGREIPMEASFGELTTDDEHLFIGVLRDITDRKHAEEERRHLETQMQHAQKLESLGVLAGGIAHDFNNLLVGVLGNAGLVLKELPSNSPSRSRIKMIKTVAQRAAELCKQLLAYAGKGRVAVEPIDVNNSIEDIVNLLETVISKQARLQLELADDLPAIEADLAQIRQVIMNLITNASDAVAASGGDISVSTGTVLAEESFFSEAYLSDNLENGLYVFIRVSDTGHGMDKTTAAKIFDPFFSTKFTGHGLGLAAVLGIIRGHGGTIKVDTTEGGGTTFDVFFPASDASPAIRPPTQQSELSTQETETRADGKTVLIVDDEEIVRTIATDALEQSGYRVLVAQNGQEGIDTYLRQGDKVDLVVLDMTMPGLSGMETLQELRRVCVDLPVILSSGYDKEDTINRMSNDAHLQFIQKPYLIQELVRLAHGSFHN